MPEVGVVEVPCTAHATSVKMIGFDVAREKPIRSPQREVTITPDCATGLVHEFAVGQNEACRGLAIEIVSGADDGNLCSLAESGIIAAVDFSWSLVISDE